MKAARLITPGQPLSIENIPEPELLPGSIKIQVEYATVPSFAAAVFSGQLPFPLPVPYTPGPSCIGTVESAADDVTGFTPGQKVLCAPHFSATVNGRGSEEILIGWFGLTSGSGPLMNRWKNGAFAEKAVFPVRCVTPLGIDTVDEKLISLAPFSIAYGGLLNCGLQQGKTIMINGATGNLGSASVFIALALGAECVYAVGRNAQVLEKLQALDPFRVRPIKVESEDTCQNILEKHAQPVDMLLDALGYVMSGVPTSAGISMVKTDGTVAFMGGVFADIPLNYGQILAKRLTIKGSFMHPAEAPSQLIAMARSNVLDLNKVDMTTFSIDNVNDAIVKAPEHRGLSYCCIAF